MMKLEQLIVLSFCVTLNSAVINYTDPGFLVFSEKRDLVGRGGGWGWGSDSGFLEKIASLLTFLAFGVFLLNLLLNALLLGSTIFGLIGGVTATGTATATGGTTTGVTTTGGTTTGGTTTGGTATGGTATGGVTASAAGLNIGGGLAVGKTRDRRSLDLQIKPTTLANTMSKELLDMIEAVISADEECIPQILCVSNRRATVAGNGFQYLMPLCSMGLSFFGEKTKNNKKFPLYVDAIFDGVEEQNCQVKYGDCHVKSKVLG